MLCSRKTFEAIKECKTDWLISCYNTPNGYIEKDKKLMRLIRKIIYIRTRQWI